MSGFSTSCRKCERLAKFLDEVRLNHADYYARPVAPFGDADPGLLIVGLAPGMHGANRTGRPFTGDHAGILLYRTLHKFGFSSAPHSTDRDDGLQLIAARITNAVKCLPPQNKPETEEIGRCNAYLRTELGLLRQGAVILALGAIAHKATLMALELRPSDFKFVHAARHVLPNGLTLFDSYHCSRYNTQTRRLTEEMFEAVFRTISTYLPQPSR